MEVSGESGRHSCLRCARRRTFRGTRVPCAGMRTFIRLKNRPVGRLPDNLHPHDVRYADQLVAEFLKEFTETGRTRA